MDGVYSVDNAHTEHTAYCLHYNPSDLYLLLKVMRYG